MILQLSKIPYTGPKSTKHERTDKWDSIKIRNFFREKIPLKEWTGKYKELLYGTYKELLHIHNEKTELFTKDRQTARKHTNRCFTLYLIRELQFKPWDTRTHLWERLKFLKNQSNQANVDMDVEQQELSFLAGENAEWPSHFAGVWQFPAKLNTVSPYHPAQWSSTLTQMSWKPAHKCLEQVITTKRQKRPTYPSNVNKL